MSVRWFVLPALAALCGCVSVKHENALVPPTGLYSHFRAPLTLPRANTPCVNLKSGKASHAVYVKDWVYTGLSAEVCDMALHEACVAGGIKKLHYADYEQQSFFGFVTLFSVTAYGE